MCREEKSIPTKQSKLLLHGRDGDGFFDWVDLHWAALIPVLSLSISLTDICSIDVFFFVFIKPKVLAWSCVFVWPLYWFYLMVYLFIMGEFIYSFLIVWIWFGRGDERIVGSAIAYNHGCVIRVFFVSFALNFFCVFVWPLYWSYLMIYYLLWGILLQSFNCLDLVWSGEMKW